MSLDELTIKSLALENGCPILLPIPFKLSIAPKYPVQDYTKIFICFDKLKWPSLILCHHF